ncbi:MAG TPA: glycosyltransferase family 4 protein [Alphaproteobacteria bacterium]
MRILIACSGYYPAYRGGGEISTKLLADGLRESGCDVEVMAASDSWAEDIVDGIKVIRVPSPNIYWSFQNAQKSFFEKFAWHTIDSFNLFAASQFQKYIDFHNYDVVHTSTIEDISPAIWQLANAKGANVAHTMRSFSLLCLSASMLRNGQCCERSCAHCWPFMALKRRYSKYVDAAVGISEFILNKHIDHGFFQQADKHVIGNISGEMPHKSDHFTSTGKIGFIGRLEQTKGIETLLCALPLLRGPKKIELLVAGTGNKKYVSSLMEMGNESNVQWLGFQKPSEFFQKIDVLVVPSIWDEPFGRVVIEAYSHGVPVIVANRGGLPELVDNGKTGLIFEAASVHSLAEKICQIMNAPLLRQAMSIAAVQMAEKFSQKEILSQHLTMYEALLTDTRRL